MIFNKSFISSLEEKCNQFECPDCGMLPLVSLLYDRDVIFPSFLYICCDSHKGRVSKLIDREMRRRMNDPLPLIK